MTVTCDCGRKGKRQWTAALMRNQRNIFQWGTPKRINGVPRIYIMVVMTRSAASPPQCQGRVWLWNLLAKSSKPYKCHRRTINLWYTSSREHLVGSNSVEFRYPFASRFSLSCLETNVVNGDHRALKEAEHNKSFSSISTNCNFTME